MRILAVSDIHGYRTGIEFLTPVAQGCDLILVAGDITDFGGRDAAAAVLSPFAGLEARMACVAGNCDGQDVLAWLAEEGISVDGRSRMMGGFRVSGVGGGLYHHGMTPNEATEEELAAGMEAAIASSAGVAESSPSIHLTHTPPNGTSLDRRKNRQVGSHSLRECLDRVKPLLWVSGHIHESRSVSRLGPSLLVNPGPLNEGCYALISIDDGRAEAELRKL